MLRDLKFVFWVSKKVKGPNSTTYSAVAVKDLGAHWRDESVCKPHLERWRNVGCGRLVY